jgi:hypothetical protein
MDPGNFPILCREQWFGRSRPREEPPIVKKKFQNLPQIFCLIIKFDAVNAKTTPINIVN